MTAPTLDPHAWDTDELAVEGTCALCGQVLLRTAGDCWHPWDVERACPPEPPSRSPEWLAWAAAGNRSGRPGREHWRPESEHPRYLRGVEVGR